jgi:hypothetical protein
MNDPREPWGDPMNQPFDDFDTQRQVEEEYPDEPWDEDGPEDHFRDDVEADADVLRMAGMGTDEDYGCYGYDDCPF